MTKFVKWSVVIAARCGGSSAAARLGTFRGSSSGAGASGAARLCPGVVDARKAADSEVVCGGVPEAVALALAVARAGGHKTLAKGGVV